MGANLYTTTNKSYRSVFVGTSVVHNFYYNLNFFSTAVVEHTGFIKDVDSDG